MSDQKKNIISEKERKQIYRAKLREELGDKEYKKQQAQKKREYRAKIKASKTPKEQKGYISDYYLNKNTNNNDSDSGTKRMLLNEGSLLSKDHSKKEIINSGAY
jgi:hypothetical protein